MRTFILPDGTVIEWASTGKVNGPLQVGGLNFGTNYSYYRVNGGEWHRSELRTLNHFAEWCAMSQSLADFREGEPEA